MKGPRDYLQDDWAEGLSPEGECPMCGESFEVLHDELCEDCTIEYEQFMDDLMTSEERGDYES